MTSVSTKNFCLQIVINLDKTEIIHLISFQKAEFMITLIHKLGRQLFFPLVLFTTSLFIPFVELPIDSARAAEVSPNYEVKLFMNSIVLNSEHELKSSVKEQY